jgi:hypothetical protein
MSQPSQPQLIGCPNGVASDWSGGLDEGREYGGGWSGMVRRERCIATAYSGREKPLSRLSRGSKQPARGVIEGSRVD